MLFKIKWKFKVNQLNFRACEALKKCLPEILHDPNSRFITDEIVKKWHLNLLENIKIPAT